LRAARDRGQRLAAAPAVPLPPPDRSAPPRVLTAVVKTAVSKRSHVFKHGRRSSSRTTPRLTAAEARALARAAGEWRHHSQLRKFPQRRWLAACALPAVGRLGAAPAGPPPDQTGDGARPAVDWAAQLAAGAAQLAAARAGADTAERHADPVSPTPSRRPMAPAPHRSPTSSCAPPPPTARAVLSSPQRTSRR
jgi:hypothetical protein